ncbi:TrgA family protein [Tropicimonas sp.]|uniref:TrgA family protein n=1 Tax=Tropicimonas sp. TaxID=2067044 RepID=UPI003A8A100F
MPTGARLVAAIGFALVALLGSEVFKPLLPEGARVGLFGPANALIGIFCGWGIVGRNAGRGAGAAAGLGVRAVAVTVFYCLLLWSSYEMLQHSIRLRYRGPVEALIAMMQMVADYFLLMISQPQVPAVLLSGGVLAALLAEWASKRFS